ncbi:transmembrane and coiled-coil domain-containing protein 6 isoform X3 [Rhinoraja longicauda]
MLRAGGALSHGHGAVEAIRARRRQQEWALRKARRETQLVSKRLLRELQDDGEEMETREPSVTQEEVLQLYQRIQRGSEDRLAALQSLCQLLHLAEAQKMFVRLENSIHVLIGLFTSNLASVQLKAAQCLLRLSHADDPIVSLVCLPATPYLLTYLSGQSAKFTEQCLYILGNLAAENEAVRNQLLLQGVVHALAGCLQSPHGAVVEAAAYSLSQLLQAKEAREKIVPAVLEASLTPRLIELLDLDSEVGMPTAVECAWCLHYIVSSGVDSECLISQGFLHQAVTLLIALGRAIDSGAATDGVELVLTLLGNIAETGPQLCEKLRQHREIFSALCTSMRTADTETVRMALEVLHLILMHCAQACEEFANHNGVEALEAIQYNSNKEIRDRANFLMDRYFTDKAV